MQADKLEQGGVAALDDFILPSREHENGRRDRYGSEDRAGHRRRRSISRDDDRDSHSSRSRRHEDRSSDDRRSHRRSGDDDDRRRRDRSDRDRGYERDHHRDRRDRGDRDRERERDRDRDRERDRDYGRDRDYSRRDRDRGDRYSERSGGRDSRDSYGGGSSGRGGGGDGGVEVFGAGNAGRSPTPEGTIPISKRKRARTAWDIKAPGFETFTPLQAKLTGIFDLPGQNRPPVTVPSAPTGGTLPTIHLGTSTDATSMSAGAAYSRQARRLYVGNITYDATEANVAQFFNHHMRNNGWANDNDPAGVQGLDPIVSVQVNHEKSYAFVEFRSASEASKAMGFDGIVFHNQVLKIRRPKDYVGPDTSTTTHIPGVVSTNVPDTPNKIFIGGLPSYLNDVQVMELLQSFGELRAFNLVKEGNTNNSKGFAFCEYLDPSITDIACQGLNGMELGDRTLVVQRAAIGANPNKSAGGGGSGANGTALQAPGLAKVDPSIIAAASDAEGEPTRVLQMLNMVTPEELIDDGEFEEIVEDIREECGKYGSVLDVKIPRPILTESGKIDQKASETLEDLGKVFVMYETVEGTKTAMMSIAGRQFGGRSIICAYAEEEKMV